MTDLMTKDNP